MDQTQLTAIGINIGLTITILGIIRKVFRVHFDKEVIRALERESPAWREAARVWFPELFTGVKAAEEANRALSNQAEELKRLNIFIEETIKPLSGLPGEIKALRVSVTGLTDIVSELGPLSKSVAILMDRTGTREADFSHSRPAKRRESSDPPEGITQRRSSARDKDSL